MVLFPNCKINLGLNITRKREDGFHDLETVFLPVRLFDALEIIQNNKGTSPSPVLLHQSGITSTVNTEDNICVKAYHLLKKDFPQLPPVEIFLHKTIPTGAGLGGGSSDGAFTLELLNTKFRLSLTPEQLTAYALELGSDCPFFIINKPCLATGRGEKLEQVNLDLSPYKILLVHPGIHVNTGWAFQQIKPLSPANSIREIIQQPVKTWKATLKNDFEEAVFKQYPDIQKIKNRLYDSGALYSAMTGSGSSVYGIFEKNTPPVLPFPDHYFVKELPCQRW